MKKTVFLLFFIWILLIPAFADYTLDSVDVVADIAENGSTEVSAAFQLTFKSVEQSVLLPLPDGVLSQISCTEEHYSVREDEGGITVEASTTGGYGGTHTFYVTYHIEAGDYSGAAMDYELPLLSARWARDISALRFQATFPGPHTAPEDDWTMEPQLISGYYNALDGTECGLAVSGNVVNGSVSGRMAYETLKLQVPLPAGYFKVRQAVIPVIALSWFAVGMLILWGICFLYWTARIRQKSRLTVTSRLMPPEGLLSCQLPQMLDGSTVDISALILEWANLGYLSIRVGKNNSVALCRSMDMGSERSKAEQQLFRQIFRGRSRVRLTPGCFSAAAARFRKSSRRSLNRSSFDKKGGNVVFVQIPCRLLCAAGIGRLAWAALPSGGGYVVLAVLAGMVGFLYSLYLHRELARYVSLRRRSLLLAGLLAVALVLLAAALLKGVLPETAAGLGACLFSAAATARGPRRSSWGVDALEQTLGCRRFYNQVSWQRLQVYCGRTERFFQQQLPYAAALGADKKLAASFEHLPCPQPEWLSGVRVRDRNAQSLQKVVAGIRRSVNQAFR